MSSTSTEVEEIDLAGLESGKRYVFVSPDSRDVMIIEAGYRQSNGFMCYQILHHQHVSTRVPVLLRTSTTREDLLGVKVERDLPADLKLRFRERLVFRRGDRGWMTFGPVFAAYSIENIFQT